MQGPDDGDDGDWWKRGEPAPGEYQRHDLN
jgi:hypothetical protein